MMDIDDRIKYEYENMLQAIMPSEQIQHAKKLAELKKEKAVMEGDISILENVFFAPEKE